MANIEDLVPGDLWDGDVCCVDDFTTGHPKHVAVDEPREQHTHLTIEQLSDKPEVKWDEDRSAWVFVGHDEDTNDDGQES